MFRSTWIDKVTFGNNVDFSSLTTVSSMHYYMNSGNPNGTTTELTYPTNADFSSLTTTGNWFAETVGPTTGPLTTCQVDNLIRRFRATAYGSALNVNFYQSQITEAPSVVRTLEAELVANGWTISENSTDATLPFAYASYAVDPTGITTISPTTTPPAGSVFTATNSLSIDSSTGVITPGSFRGGSTIRCTYPDGCYNEVVMLIQVPFTMRRLIPAAGQTALVGTMGSQYIDWGDGTAETNTGTASHAYSAAGTGFGTWRTIKIFDKSATEKFTGMQANGSYYDRVNIEKWGDPVFDYLRFAGVYALGIRTAANDPLNTTSLTSFEEMFASNGSYRTNARLIDPYNNLDTWKTSTATNGGAITTFKNMFASTSSLGQQCVNDESTFTFSFPAGTTATAGTYGSGTSNSAINGRTQSGTTVDYSIKFQIIIDGSGTVTLDNTNTHIIPQYMYQGDNVSVGDVIRIDAGAFGSLNNSITCTLTSDNVLASNGICNLNGWDTSQVTDFSFMFNHNSGRTGGRRIQNVNFGNWNLSNATDFNTFCNLGNPSGLKGTDLTPKNVSAADSPTGSAYIAWDTSNVTNFNSFCYLGDVPLGILKYWRFNTTNNFSMSAMFYNMDLQSHISDEPCKTQVISSGDSNNPFGADYTAWNMDKCSSVSSFAYRQTSPPGMTVLTPALSSWQISDALTSFTNFSRSYSGSFTFTPTVGAWDPSGVSGSQYWHSTRSGEPWQFSRSAYDNLLDITNGWGGHASTVNSGVTLNMGTSQYSPGNVVSVTWTANSSSSGTNTLKTNGFNLQAATSIGDIIYYPASVGTTQTAYARITGYNSTDEATTTTTNWPTGAGSARSFQIYDSNAAKGRFALVEAGWNITDGGAYIPFDSAEFTITTIGDNETFTIWSHGMNAKIDWGDGNGFINDPNTGSPYVFYAPQFTYATQGTYTIKIMETVGETFNGFRFGFGYPYNNQSGKRVQSLVNWGTSPVTSFSQAFDRSENLTTIPVDANGYAATPSFSSATSMDSVFNGTGLTTVDMRNWDPSTAPSVTNISNMFAGIAGFAGNGLDQWDVSNITNMSGLIGGSTANTVFNVDITGWDTRNVTNLSYMFRNVRAFNQNIGNWRTESVTNLSGMFQGAYAFNQDINTKVVGSGASAYIAWDTSNNQNWNGMFMDAQAFNTSIDKWEIDQVSSDQGMCYMFGRTSVFNQDLLTKDVTIGTGTPVAKTYVAWDVSYIQTFGIRYNSPSVATNHGMFEGNTVFNGDISNWDIASTNARSDGKVFNRTFISASAFNQDLSQKAITNVTGKGNYNAWDVSAAEEFNSTFQGASSFNQNLSNWQLNSSADIFHNVFRSSGMSTNNYTDTVVGWANYVQEQNPDAPLNVQMQNQNGRTFDATRTASGFTPATAGRARSFLLLDVTVSGGTGVNGVYYYDYANDKWVKETDSTYVIEWNGDESSWELKYEGSVVNAGSGGTEAGGPESATSWSGGLTVVDSSKGWTISNDTITT